MNTRNWDKNKRKENDNIKKKLEFYRVRADEELLYYYKKILKIKGIKQQDYFDKVIKDCILDNLYILMENEIEFERVKKIRGQWTE